MVKSVQVGDALGVVESGFLSRRMSVILSQMVEDWEAEISWQEVDVERLTEMFWLFLSQDLTLRNRQGCLDQRNLLTGPRGAKYPPFQIRGIWKQRQSWRCLRTELEWEHTGVLCCLYCLGDRMDQRIAFDHYLDPSSYDIVRNSVA